MAPHLIVTLMAANLILTLMAAHLIKTLVYSLEFDPYGCSLDFDPLCFPYFHIYLLFPVPLMTALTTRPESNQSSSLPFLASQFA